MRIYLDTSVISYLDATDTPDKMKDTVRLWSILTNDSPCDVVISDVVLDELDDCPEPKQTFILKQLNRIQYELVSRTDEVLVLAENYIQHGVLSKNHLNDLLHIAHATIYGCSSVLSWNFKHFVNFKTIDRVNAVHLFMGYSPIRIASPSMILGELENE